MRPIRSNAQRCTTVKGDTLLVLRRREGGRGGKKEEKTKAESDDRGIKGEREVNGQVSGALQGQRGHLRESESVGIYRRNT